MNKQIFIRILFIHIFALAGFTAESQELITLKAADTHLIKMVNGVKTYNQFSGKDLTVTLLEVTNPAGSAREPETEQVTSNIYFGLTEADLNPKQALYTINNVFAPSDFKVENAEPGVVWVSFEYLDRSGNISKKKKVIVKLTLTTATIVKSAD